MPKGCARLNGGSSCSYDDVPFQQGTFKIVWRGKYDDGPRRGERCVIKEFKEGSVYEDYYFQEEMRIIRDTERFVDEFNDAEILGSRRVRVNRPVIATGIRGRVRGVKALVEPYVEHFEKYNSNSGWVNPEGGEWGDAIQALSHFSYHSSNGKYLLCDLQGGTYRDGFVLTDPIIMSQRGNLGPGDLGEQGILAFFQRHRCNRFCRGSWMSPGGGGGWGIPSKKGTVYDLRSRPSRNPLSAWFG